uniref:Putative secreted peptide n=1 Tax=Anopheles braziliensis TaxID=58242 RepID=A0A2M3ZT18_9DIPT
MPQIELVVVPTVVLLDRLVPATTAHHVVIELAPFTVVLGIDVDNIMTTVIVTRVHEHRMQDVSSRRIFR